MTQQIMTYPSVYPDANSIIPYSKNKRFGFTSPELSVIDLESMKNMSIDEIVNLYRQGHTIENTSPIIRELYKDTSPSILSADGISISTGAILVVGAGVLLFLYLTHRI